MIYKPKLEAEVASFIAAKRAAPATSRRLHSWGPSTAGHGEMQCVHCLMTNREATILGPYCLQPNLTDK